MSLGVVAQRGNERAVSLADRLRAAIGEDEVAVDALTGEALGIDGHAVADLSDCDLVVSIGGDGTFLFLARHVTDTPIAGVNLGEVGFLTAIPPENAVEILETVYEDARRDRLEVTTVPRLAGVADGVTVDPALNELMVQAPERGTDRRMAVVVRVDGEEYDRSEVDGVMVATAAGSTAYNLSERGPLVAPGVEAFVINQMCAAAGRPPLVVPFDVEIEIELGETDFAYLIGDGRDRHRLDTPEAITITRSAHPLRLAGPPVEFYDALDRLS